MNTKEYTPNIPDSGQAVTSADNGIETMLAGLAAQIDGYDHHVPAVNPVASPIHRGVESVCVRVNDAEGRPCHFVKILHPEMRFWVDADTAHRAAIQAADHRLAPAARVLPAGALVMPYVDSPWYTGQLNHLADPQVLANVLRARKQLQTLPVLGVRFDVFERLASLEQMLSRHKVPVPDDLEWLLAHANDAREAIAAVAIDLTFCHNDGIASNHLLHPDGRVLLVDFDLAADNDPWYDTASLLNEVCEFPSEWPRLVEPVLGEIDRRIYHRMRLYAACEDLMWGMWGLLLSVLSDRKNIEYFKYGQWRLLRCRMAMKDWSFEHWLREL